MWQSLKSLKNKFWILLSLANIILFTHDAIYMYYNFNYWGAEGFPEHYANKETYIATNYIFCCSDYFGNPVARQTP